MQYLHFKMGEPERGATQAAHSAKQEYPENSSVPGEVAQTMEAEDTGS